MSNKVSYSSFHKQAESKQTQKQKPIHNNDNNDDDDENNDKELTPQQIERIYSQLATKVLPIDRKSNTYTQIVNYSQNTPNEKEYFVDVKDAFSAVSLDANGEFQGNKHLLLWFGIRLSSVAAILVRGLKPSLNNITEWRNLIFYDIVLPAAEQAYLFSNKKGHIKNKGVLMLCQVSFNDILELDSAALVDDIPPPTDGTVIKLTGKYSPDSTSTSTLGGVKYPNGKIRKNEDSTVVPCGNYNQYIIANPAQIKIKYIITAECRTNNLTMKPTKDFITIPQQKSNIKSFFSAKPSNQNNNNNNNGSNKGEKRKRDEEEDEEERGEREEKGKGKKPQPVVIHSSPPSPSLSPPLSPGSPPSSPPLKNSSSSVSSTSSSSFISTSSSSSSPSATFISTSSSSFSSSTSTSSSSSTNASPNSKKEVKNKIWQYLTHGGWRDFSEEHNHSVNTNAEQNKRKFEVSINSTAYTIDTTNGVQYQTNDPTKRRKIRVKPK